MAYTTTSASAVMLEYHDPAVYKTFAQEDNTFRAFMEGKTERTNIRGRLFSLTVRPNASYGSIAEGGQLPLAHQPLDVVAKIYYLNQFKTGEINKEVLDQDDDKALVSFSRHNIESATETFMEDQELWVFGTGSGSLGVVSDVTNIGTFIIVFGGDYGSENIRIGARLNFYSSANSQRTGGSISVATVLANDVDTGSVTFDAVPTNAVATDYVTYENSQGNAFHGLQYHIADTTTTWLGLSPSTYPTLKSTVHDAAGNPLTPGMIDLVQAKTRKRGGTSAPLNDFALIMHPAQEYSYRSLGYDTSVVVQQVIMDGSKRTLDLGFTNVMHNGMRFRLSQKCARSDIWGIRFSDWAVEYLKKPGLYQDAHGETMWQKSGTGTPYDAVQFAIMWRGDLALKKRERQFRIKNLAYLAGL